MRVPRQAEPMTRLDKLAVLALRRVNGMSHNSYRIAGALLHRLRQNAASLTVHERHALYAICWRFRRQIPMHLQVKVAIQLADAKAAAEQLRIDTPRPDQVRADRAIAASPATKRNPLDDLFSETVTR